MCLRKCTRWGCKYPATGIMGILAELAAEGNSGLVCVVEAGLAGGADGRAAAGVFVFGGDVADAFVEPHGVVVAVQPGPRHDRLGFAILDCE